jgi:hypothetical protein
VKNHPPLTTKPLFATAPTKKAVNDIEVTPTAIRIGPTEINREGWEIFLFQNPDISPRKLTFLKPIPEEESEVHTQIEISFEPSLNPEVGTRSLG